MLDPSGSPSRIHSFKHVKFRFRSSFINPAQFQILVTHLFILKNLTLFLHDCYKAIYLNFPDHWKNILNILYAIIIHFLSGFLTIAMYPVIAKIPIFDFSVTDHKYRKNHYFESCSSGRWENGRKRDMTQIFNNCGQE